MGLRNIIVKAVAIANKATKDLQPSVTHYPWIAQTGFGKPTFDTPYGEGITRTAIVEKRVQTRQSALTNKVVTTIAHITFLVPFDAIDAEGRENPIDPRDRFVLSDGTSAPIVDIAGFIDRQTGYPYFAEVWLGQTGAV
jgi:hypothetical protein